jgi:flagellar hook-associated protein 1 FlgK
MSLSQALSTSTAGLRTTQSALALIASNVANAETPGYVRKTLVQSTTAAGTNGVGVRVASINRELDIYLQRQLRTEAAGGSYANLRADFYKRLQSIYGTPGGNAALETTFNNFTNALQALATSPDAAAARSAVISAGQILAQQLNAMSQDIQGLRADAELGLSDSVARANNAMTQIAAINRQLALNTAPDAAAAALLDQRDGYIDELSQLMDIRVITTDHNQISVFTNSGIQLVGTQAARLAFDAQGTMTPGSAARSICSRAAPSARARSRPMSRCATTCWSGRSASSTPSPPAWPRRSPTRRLPEMLSPLVRRMATTSTPPTFAPATASTSPILTAPPASSTA